eukprot:CAMPEP_0167766732 /NCGR_PEP_ID=MMETSP0110_2-20121227/15536_1 /TAXON_ID=629695 /ORGANISM="Gymnochlora sp., Strain CCMP2014" /LENGTH=81 /DNA_ID=CAMNT_0007654849 /DNA_START=272 /DNA_END=514 /DNA_ORIENTATION=+
MAKNTSAEEDYDEKVHLGKELFTVKINKEVEICSFSYLKEISKAQSEVVAMKLFNGEVMYEEKLAKTSSPAKRTAVELIHW